MRIPAARALAASSNVFFMSFDRPPMMSTSRSSTPARLPTDPGARRFCIQTSYKSHIYSYYWVSVIKIIVQNDSSEYNKINNVSIVTLLRIGP